MKKRSLSLGLSALILSALPLNVIAETSNAETDQSVTVSSETSDINEPDNGLNVNDSSAVTPSDVTKDDAQTTETSSEADTTNEAIAESTPTEESSEVTDETKTDEIAKTETAETKATSGVVRNIEQLKAQIADSSISEITLGADLYLGREALPVNHSVTINGDGHTITYGSGSAGSMNAHMGIYFNTNGITITYKNINFGKSGAADATTNANNWYGIAPAYDTLNDIHLVVENINYYSNYGSQAFHLPAADARVTLKGVNNFELHAPKGDTGQEFFEGSNIAFADNSTTVINSTNMDEGGIVWGRLAPVRMTIGENATVEIDSRQDIMWSSKEDNTLNIGANSSLIAHQTYDKAPTNATGKIVGGTTHSLAIITNEGSKLDLRTPNTSSFNNLEVQLGKDSTTSFATAGDRVFTTGKPSTFTLNNIDQLLFKSEKESISKVPNVIGSIGTLNFAEFTADIEGYGTFVNGQTETPLFEQDKNDSWTLDSKSGISLTTINADQTKAVNNANQILIKRGAVGRLTFEKVTERLNWTNRLINESKGILNRDEDNNLEVVVKDTRSKSKKTDWTVTAKVETPENFDKFSLVWKNNASDNAINLDRVVLKNSDVTPENNIYTKTWGSDAGVLLKSDDYLPIGDYSDQLKINWTLNNVTDKIE